MFYKNRFFSIITVLIFVFVSNCTQSKTDEITIDKFISELKCNPNFVVLDVRTEEELSGLLGKIKGSIHIEISELADRLSELEEYKDKEIGVICRSGVRSARGTGMLNTKGFKAKNVSGGMLAYNKKINEGFN